MNLKALRRTAVSQGHKEFLEKVQQDEEEFRSLCQEFKKERLSTKKGCTVRFALGVWKDRYSQRSGTRVEREGEMMWHGEFLEFCRTAKMGWLTPEESEAKWQALVQDPKTKRDRDGPRGFLRVRVPVRDTVNQFDEGSHERSFDRESSKVNLKHVTEEDLKRKAEAVYQDNDDNLLASADFRDKLMRQAGTEADGSTFDNVALFGKDLEEMVAEVVCKASGSIEVVLWVFKGRGVRRSSAHKLSCPGYLFWLHEDLSQEHHEFRHNLNVVVNEK